MQELDLELKVIQRFILKSKIDRYLSFVKKKETRKKFISELNHMNFLALELFVKVEGDERNFIKDKIKGLGDIKDCYIISENGSLDCKRLDINTALRETVGTDTGTLLVFGEAQILYAEAEGFNNRWISIWKGKQK